MTDAVGNAQITSIRAWKKSYDAAVLVSFALFTIGVVVVLGASAFSGGPGQINPDLVIAYP
jgi:hypothetical protein